MTFEERTINQIRVFELKGKVMGGLNSRELRERLKKRISEVLRTSSSICMR
ncbi:hypothetical protein MJD09_26355 [bacterium]|nr:hypothetical protein [bacterium]